MNGDPVRLAQVVANLLNNAARYTDSGGHIALSARQEGGNQLCISVKDNGAGIPEEMLVQIFELFYQGKQNIERAQGGLGIGLSIVKNLVALHGGTIEARSRGLGYGSEFVLKLPVKSLSAELAAPVAAPVSEVETAICKRRILLVDDNVDAATTLERLLEASGHDVEVFSDPVSALSAVRRFKPEIAVLDIGLPVLNGYDLAAQLRSALDGQPCRFIALTGYGQEADRAKSHAAGFEQHLVKPISPEQIIGLINLKNKN
jgi:CheY-like chemotaxis protein